MLRVFGNKLRHMGFARTSVNIKGYMVMVILVITSIFIPYHAEAGVFSFISHLFSSSVSAEEVSPNSQNMPLLQASISPNQSSNSKKDIAIVGGTSLATDSSLPVDGKTAEDDQITLYVVHQGDTLPAIAKMFGVTVNTIKWGNDLKSNSVTVGQTLVILPISGVQHTVKAGETLQSIAKLHKGDMEEILQYNNLSEGSKIAVGDVITIPDGEVVTTVVPKKVAVGVKITSNVTDGYFMKPIVGGVRTQGIHGHNGVDLASAYGSKILASADGEVIISKSTGYNGGYGLYVVIKHSNGTQTLYAHMSETFVNNGERVSQGQVIGKMGSTGKSTGVHLHFEVRGARNPF